MITSSLFYTRTTAITQMSLKFSFDKFHIIVSVIIFSVRTIVTLTMVKLTIQARLLLLIVGNFCVAINYTSHR